MSTAVNHLGYHYPELRDGCTGCAACLFVCPDFVFEVFRDKPMAVPSEGEDQRRSYRAAPEPGPERPAPKAHERT
jgi:hypothetical protein